MAFTTLNLGLTLTIPTNGTRNWGNTMFSTTWTRISQHAHTGSGDGNQITAAGLANGAVTKPKLANNVGFFQYATALDPTGNVTQDVDWNNGMIQVVDLSNTPGTITFTLSNPLQGAIYIIYFLQASPAAAPTFVWPSNVQWAGGVAFLVSSAASAVDKVQMYYDGTDYYADWDTGYA